MSAAIWALEATAVHIIDDWRLSEVLGDATVVPEPRTTLLLGAVLLALVAALGAK